MAVMQWPGGLTTRISPVRLSLRRNDGTLAALRLMVVVGAHYLPFVFLYGMWEFAVLCGVLVGGGVASAWLALGTFSRGL